MTTRSPMIEELSELVLRGVKEGTFIEGVDAMQLYMSIAAEGYFYLSNVHTMTALFGRELLSKVEIEKRREHICAVILGYMLK